ncbi:DNA adenine methylase [Microbacterium sp. SL75]|uniref:DNA adenine methylase n=1 Tax=Microbacterium sp. SL75 TaxID=2995140 RepID=UPI00226E75D8|nr:DNA adenine methylase [Microbacterium sp. SL75]WAC70166.1 DNA adenine methylase [Microbacterium sp. SL75]
MKYMGGKSALLRGSLGDLVLEEAEGADRFVDLFSGAGSVGHFVAERAARPVLSADLQTYSKVLSAVIVERVRSLEQSLVISSWLAAARKQYDDDAVVARLRIEETVLSAHSVRVARQRASEVEGRRLTRHYGGHYFAPLQALAFDHMLSGMPEDLEIRTLALAAVIRAASACAAAPGHTAQPFQPTGTLLPYIRAAWKRDAFGEVQRQLDALAPRHARVRGHARVSDAEAVAGTLSEGDLAFCDPPYSSVQYSRFYHVLEGIARGGWDTVSGAGRAPARGDRASSDFSRRTAAVQSLTGLLQVLRLRGCQVMITFPDGNSSNGLSAAKIVELAKAQWHVTSTLVDSTHSTLGGRSEDARGGRRKLKEAVIVLRPKQGMIAVAMNTPPATKDGLNAGSTASRLSEAAAS